MSDQQETFESAVCIACGAPIVRSFDGPVNTGWRHLMPRHVAVPAVNPRPPHPSSSSTRSQQ